MRACTRQADRARVRRRSRSALAPAAALLLSSAATYAAGFQINAASVSLASDFYTVQAEAEFEFSETALEALANGVSLTVNIEVELKRQRKYLWDPLVVRAIQGYRLERHELTEQYLITNTTLGIHRNFKSLNDAILSLGELDPIAVMEIGSLDSAQTYGFRIRSRLDIESLPAPLRPVAYFSPNWRLSSSWFSFPLP